METDKPCCPRCGATDNGVRKHGQHLGKQRYYCKNCGLAFTGGQYTHRPEHDLNAAKAENKRALKCLEAARRMSVALDAYLESGAGKARTRLDVTRERFKRLLADIQMDGAAIDMDTDQEEDLTGDSHYGFSPLS